MVNFVEWGVGIVRGAILMVGLEFRRSGLMAWCCKAKLDLWSTYGSKEFGYIGLYQRVGKICVEFSY